MGIQFFWYFGQITLIINLGLLQLSVKCTNKTSYFPDVNY